MPTSMVSKLEMEVVVASNLSVLFCILPSYRLCLSLEFPGQVALNWNNGVGVSFIFGTYGGMNGSQLAWQVCVCIVCFKSAVDS